MNDRAPVIHWLRRTSPEYQPFMGDLTQMLVSIAVVGLACVITVLVTIPGIASNTVATSGSCAARHSALRWSAPRNMPAGSDADYE